MLVSVVGVRYGDGSVASGIWLTIRTAAGLEGPYQALDLWWYVVVQTPPLHDVCVGCCVRASWFAWWLNDGL